MKVTKEIHRMWKEWESMPQEVKDKLHGPIIGKWCFNYENKHGKIDLIKLNHNLNFHKGNLWNHCWETCGNLELSRFNTRKDAETAIYVALNEGQRNPKIEYESRNV